MASVNISTSWFFTSWANVGSWLSVVFQAALKSLHVPLVAVLKFE